ncbi:hypothetical protein R7P80_18025 [Vibrio sp. 2092]|nr:hypothetical protein [Vibrio parahaemolyticus]MDW2154702.1 hypothetical protein [Vibrio sp. 2092]RFD37230.1 hypothetical protein BS585_17565 [Vibrio parahaemolyticus]HAT8517736.1 hypothetical protein [Vibrio vulnificus]
MKRALDNNQIIDELLRLHKLDNDNQLANHYGVERQQIRQFRNAKRVGLPQNIMSELLIFSTSQKKED